MDDTHQSRPSDAAATRKRRSSILKSVRPARAPFSELEFNVATPTDTVKSRRVSFSRRTGVAEFVTNEATTTWENFYEKHNKSLESSGNDSAQNPPRPSVGHLGKRIFEDQFQEVEAIDLVSTLNVAKNVDSSISNVKFDQYALDCTADEKLSAPVNNFEYSAFTVTEPSKLYNDLAASGMVDVTDKININFSTMQPVDDLDEIQKDVERQALTNVVCSGPKNRVSMSGYIEVDLDMTHVAEDQMEIDDMSITDTVRSPKVNVSKSNTSEHTDKSKDWVADKENIAINPYVTPKESTNFAINEEPDKVLVFDGKRLTVQSSEEPVSDYRKTLLPFEEHNKTPQRKTIVLNMDDDLPNFVANSHTSLLQTNLTLNKTSHDNNFDLSTTQPVLAKIEMNSSKHKTIVYDDGDISVTQALPTNIAHEAPEKRRTIVFDNEAADISITQALPTNIDLNKLNQHRTIVFDNEDIDMSVTKAIPSNIALEAPQKRRTIVFDNDATDTNTQTLPSNTAFNKPDKHKTIVFDNDDADMSVTKALPANIVQEVQEKRRTIVFDNEDADMSVTKAIPSNIGIEAAQKRRTIVFEDADMSVTKAIPSNIVKEGLDKLKTIVFDNDDADMSVTKAVPSNIVHEAPQKRRTIVFDNETADMSHTQALPSNIELRKPDKRRTIVFENEDADMSVTQAIPTNIPIENQEIMKTIIFDDRIADKSHDNTMFNDEADLSMTQAISSHVVANNLNENAKTHRPIVVHDEKGNITITQALQPDNYDSKIGQTIPVKNSIIIETDLCTISVHKISTGIKSPNASPNENSQEEKRQISMFTGDSNIPTSKKLLQNIILTDPGSSIKELKESELLLKQMIPEYVKAKLADEESITIKSIIPVNLIVPETTEEVLGVMDLGSISRTNNFIENENLPANSINDSIESPINVKGVLKNDVQSMDFTNIPVPLSQVENHTLGQRKTIVYENQDGNLSVTQAVSTQLIVCEQTNKAFDRKNGIIAITSITAELIVPENTVEYQTDLLKNTTENHEVDAKTEVKSSDSSGTTLTVLKNTVSEYLNENELKGKTDENGRAPSENKDNDDADISMTFAEEHEKLVCENRLNNPSMVILEDISQSKTTDCPMVFDIDDATIDNQIKELKDNIKQNELNKTLNGIGLSQQNMSQRIQADIIDNMQKVLSAKSKTERITNDGAHLKDVIVYQTSSNKSVIYPCVTDSVSLLSTIPSSDGELDPASTESIRVPKEFVNTEYVTISQKMPVPGPDTDIKESKPNQKHDLCNNIMDINMAFVATDSSAVSVTDSANSQDTCKENKNCDVSKLIPQSDQTKKAEILSNTETCVMHQIVSDTASQVLKKQKAIEESILHDLLDMSESGIMDQGVTAKMSNDTAKIGPNQSNESMFYITKDITPKSEEEKSIDTESSDLNPKSEVQSNMDLQMEYEDCVGDLERTLLQRRSFATNRHIETVMSKDDTSDKRKSYKNANSTQELVDMLSHFTEKEEKENPIKPMSRVDKKGQSLQEPPRQSLGVKVQSIKEAPCQSLGVKGQSLQEAARQSLGVSRRQSVVLSREDLMNNISMAKAILENPCCDSEMKSGSSSESPSPNKNAHINPEIVRTLRFEDDDSGCDKDQVMVTPLKKTAFGETSYMIEENKKGRVIPTYLKDVSDGIKALMGDLVKPMIDTFDTGVDRELVQKPSTCSTQIQANIITSSQVDILESNNSQPESLADAVCRRIKGIIKSPAEKIEQSPEPDKSPEPVKSPEPDKSPEPATLSESESRQTLPPQEREHVSYPDYSSAPTIVFDPINPLNNVLIPPMNFKEAHRYRPAGSDSESRLSVAGTCTVTFKDEQEEDKENVKEKDKKSIQNSDKSEEKAKVKVVDKVNVLHVIPHYSSLSHTSSVKNASFSIYSDTSKSKSMDRSVNTLNKVTKEKEINTVVAMQDNKKLLEMNSCLTLIETPESHKEITDTKSNEPSVVEITDSAVQVIYEQGPSKNSGKDESENKKRKYVSNHDQSPLSHMNMTPKPASKIPKHVNSPVKLGNVNSKQEVIIINDEMDCDSPKCDVDKSNRNAKPLVVQQMYGVGKVDGKTKSTDVCLLKNNTESIGSTNGSISSSVTDSLHRSNSNRIVNKLGFVVDWQPELLNELSSKNLVMQSDSTADVRRIIDNMPFIGSSDCEWESISEREWSFRLLHGGLRLRVALDKRTDTVYPDTPVSHIAVENILNAGRKSMVALLCVRFAREAMEYIVSRGCARAADVPPMLRRCAAVARVALRWGRAMHDSYLHLAYDVNEKGYLSLKVANCPLRSVWEVTMHIALAVEDPGEVPWPRANDVRVSTVISDYEVSPQEVRRVIARTQPDWGHAPRTLWKMFRYLKNKTGEEV